MIPNKKCETVPEILDKYGKKDIKLDSMSRTQTFLYRELNSTYFEFVKWSCILFVLLEDNSGFQAMYKSICKQKNLVYATVSVSRCNKLEKHEIEILRVFQKKSTKRLENVQRIAEENLKETIYYPYFQHIEENGISLFEDILIEKDGYKVKEAVNAFKDNARKYNTEHCEELRSFFTDLERKREEYEELKRIRKENVKQEKEEARRQRKAEREEIKEIKKNAAAHRERDRQLGSVGSHFYYTDKVKKL